MKIGFRQWIGVGFKSVAILICLLCGAFFGTSAMEYGHVPTFGILGFIVAGCFYWIGTIIHPDSSN
jgi:hypothetical protein